MIKRLALLIHGFNVWDGGRATIGKLQPLLVAQGISCILVNYGYLGLAGTYAKNKKIARNVTLSLKAAKLAGYQVTAFGHSNGCAILDIATHTYKAPLHKAVYINPALDKDRERSSTVDFIDVWHSESDKPVKWSKHLPFHPWGEMGAVGYQGPPDESVRNFDKQHGYQLSSKAHSDVFDIKLLPFFGEKVIHNAFTGASMDTAS